MREHERVILPKVARLVDKNGHVLILKNNKPRYIVMEVSVFEEEQLIADEYLHLVSKRFMEKNRKAYEELAK